MESKKNKRFNRQRTCNRMNKRENLVVFINEELKSELESLQNKTHEDEELYNFIKRAITDLKQNPFCGVRIKKKLWPKEYTKKYEITNLRKYDLPRGWRIVYTTERDEIKIISILLEWFNHKDYNRRFRY